MGNDPKPPQVPPIVWGNWGDAPLIAICYWEAMVQRMVICVILLRIVLNGSRTAKCHNSRFANIQEVTCHVVTTTFCKGGNTSYSTQHIQIQVCQAPESLLVEVTTGANTPRREKESAFR